MTKLLCLAAVLAACTDGDPAPSATVTMATPEQLAPADDARDDLVIVVEYADGDGDLGGGTAEIHDCRAEGVMTALAIPQIAPQPVVDDGTRITGTLELHANDIGALGIDTLPVVCDELGVGAVEPATAVFCVVLVDAAGNRGDGDCTPAIGLANEAARRVSETR